MNAAERLYSGFQNMTKRNYVPTRPHMLARLVPAHQARKLLGRLDITVPYVCLVDNSRYPAAKLREIRRTHR